MDIEKAKLAKESLENALSKINDQFFLLNREWCYTYVNDRVIEMVGLPKEKLLSKCIWELFPETIGSQFYTEVHRAVAEQTIVQFECFYQPLERWFQNRIYPSTDGVAILVTDITLRKQNEEVLAKQTTLLQEQAQLLDLAIDAIIVRDLSGKITFWNYGAQQLYGWTKEEAIGNSTHTLLQTQFPQPLDEIQAQLFRTGRWEGELIHIKRDGTPVVVIGRWAVKRDELSQPSAILEINHDITDRKQALEVLRSSEERFRLMAENSTDIISRHTIDGIMLYVSPACYPILGYHPEEIVGRSSSEFVHPDDLTEIAKNYPISPTLPKIYTITHRARHKNGNYIWIEATVRAIRDSQTGEILEIQASSRDITERKRAIARMTRLQAVTAALSQSLTQTRVTEVIVEQGMAAMGADAALVALLTESGTELEIVRAVGYKPEVVESWRRFSIETPTPLAEAVRTGKPVWEESKAERIARYPHLAQAYAKYDYNAWISIPLMIEAKALGGISIAFAEIQKFNQDDLALILTVAQQCAQALERARLYEADQIAREAAESANRIKDEFLAILSHELRSPLNPILGWSKLLQSHTFDHTKTIQGLQTIERNAKVQAQLIEDLLDISRILQGKLSLNIYPVDLVSVISAAMETVRLSAETKSIDLRFTIVDFGLKDVSEKKLIDKITTANTSEFTQREAKDICNHPLQAAVQNLKFLVLGDSSRLQQVIWNILSNAVKFTPEGGRVEVRLSLSPPTYAEIIVSDTGKGIHPDFLPYVFDSFRQENSTTTRKFGGLGLGLAIVRRLVELHGGTVHASSSGIGQGATLTVRLPLMQGQSTVEQDSRESEPPPNLDGIKILVVDDDEDTREFIVFLLEECKASVTAVSSAREALVILSQSPPDVLLSDIGMPDMDGYTLIHHIRMLPPEQGGDIPAIALTAYAGDINEEKALQAGFQKHISKPVEPALLVEVIHHLVNERP